MATITITSLFRDDRFTGNERLHYDFLRPVLPDNHFFVYPNIALQVLVNKDSPAVQKELQNHATLLDDPPGIGWDTRNFLLMSSVDLCIITKPDYMPVAVFEIDGKSHQLPHQQLCDALKDRLLRIVGFEPARIRVDRDQFTDEKRRQLSRTVRTLSNTTRPHSNKLIRGILLTEEIARHFGLLNAALNPRQALVFPNLAIQSIFDKDEAKKLFKHDSRMRNFYLTALVHLCVVEPMSLRPICAVTIKKNDLQTRLFEQLNFPLLDLSGFTSETMSQVDYRRPFAAPSSPSHSTGRLSEPSEVSRYRLFLTTALSNCGLHPPQLLRKP
jgi:hypothetical protein